MGVVAENGSGLSVTESAKLENLEEVIDGGLKSFIEVGRALMEIREGRLYRATHMQFESYSQPGGREQRGDLRADRGWVADSRSW
jgi:hypothetical protein